MAAAAQPDMIPNDWMDVRTENTERYYPESTTNGTPRKSARGSKVVGTVVRGHTNTTPITYGNVAGQVSSFLNSKDRDPPPSTRMAERILPSNNMTMRLTLIKIVKLFHMLAVASISPIVLQNDALGKKRRPQNHLATAKINIMARLIVVVTMGTSTNMDSLSELTAGIVRGFVKYALEFITKRLSSSEYGFTPSIHDLTTAKWSNFKKTIKRRAEGGMWSNAYCENLVSGNKVTAKDGQIVNGVFDIVGVYCYKMWDKFHSHVANKAIYMLPAEYEGAIWGQKVGELLYMEQNPDGESDVDDENDIPDIESDNDDELD